MDVRYRRSSERLTIDGTPFDVEARVPMLRLVDSTRELTNIARTMPTNEPYDPQPFPLGVVNITDIRARSDHYRAPFFVATDMSQRVRVWETSKDDDGVERYERPSPRYVTDYGSGIHYSEHATTQGCIKVTRLEDLVEFVSSYIRPALERGEKIRLHVEA